LLPLAISASLLSLLTGSQAVKSFWGKRQNDAGVRVAAGDSEGPSLPADRRFTLDLLRAAHLATMVARSRAAQQVEVADMLAGMYIYEWSRLSQFWEDGEQVEDFLRRICSISPERWQHWIEVYDRRRAQETDERSALKWLLARLRGRAAEARADQESSLRYSIELEKLFDEAGEIATARDELEGRTIPVLTTECVLLCMARNPESEIGRKLEETGLDVRRLERVARDPRRAPHL
jgi:hypothetical protein